MPTDYKDLAYKTSLIMGALLPPAYWKEFYRNRGDKYNKILEIINRLNYHGPRHESGGLDEIAISNHDRTKHSDIDQSLLTTDNVEFNNVLAALLKTNEVQSSSDAEHKILMDPAADEIHIKPGDDSGDNYWILKAIDAGVSSPSLLPSSPDEGYIGGPANKLAYIYTKKLGLEIGATPNEFSIDGTLAGNSDDAVPTEKAVKTYVDGELITQIKDSMWLFVDNGAVVVNYVGTSISYPASDADARCAFRFATIDASASFTTVKIRVTFRTTGSGTWQGKTYAGAYAVGETGNTWNILNGTNEDYTESDAANKIGIHEITLTGVAAGDTVGGLIGSRAANADIMYIHSIQLVLT